MPTPGSYIPDGTGNYYPMSLNIVTGIRNIKTFCPLYSDTQVKILVIFSTISAVLPSLLYFLFKIHTIFTVLLFYVMSLVQKV